MKTTFAILLVISALLLAAGLTACKSGGSGGAKATATPTSAGQDTEGNGTPAGGADTTPTDGDDDGGPADEDLEAYFEALERIAVRTDDELEAASDEISNAVFNTDQEEIEGTRDALQRVGMALERALLDVEALEAPSGVRSEHDVLREALLDLVVLSADLFAATEDVTTTAELDAAGQQFEPQLTAADEALDEACFSVQGVAEQNGITADLRCG